MHDDDKLKLVKKARKQVKRERKRQQRGVEEALSFMGGEVDWDEEIDELFMQVYPSPLAQMQ